MGYRIWIDKINKHELYIIHKISQEDSALALNFKLNHSEPFLDSDLILLLLPIQLKPFFCTALIFSKCNFPVRTLNASASHFDSRMHAGLYVQRNYSADSRGGVHFGKMDRKQPRSKAGVRVLEAQTVSGSLAYRGEWVVVKVHNVRKECAK